MAETDKKYLDFSTLDYYDGKLKTHIDKKDSDNLAAAKAYADGLATNYDAAGTAQTKADAAEANAKAYTDAQVKTANDAAAAANTAAGTAAAAAQTAQTAAEKAQGEVDALEVVVGTLPADGGYTSVVDMVTKKTAGIATDAALSELRADVDKAEQDIAAIKADYLVEADKTELQTAITNEETARTQADAALDERLVEVETFFQTTEGETLDAALDTLVEIQDYVNTHGAAADQMVANISANATAISQEKTRAEGAESALGERIDGVEADVAELQEKFGEGEGSVADMIADAVAGEATLREQEDGKLDAKITANATGVTEAKAAAKTAQDEVDALELVVADKADQSAHDALAGRVTTAEGDITTLKGASHTHAHQDVIDGITAQMVEQWNAAHTNNHTHENMSVLNGITSTLIGKWNAAETNAKTYAKDYTDAEIAKFVAITPAEVDTLFV